MRLATHEFEVRAGGAPIGERSPDTSPAPRSLGGDAAVGVALLVRWEVLPQVLGCAGRDLVAFETEALLGVVEVLLHHLLRVPVDEQERPPA